MRAQVQSPLIAWHFLRSNRAGLALHARASNAAAISVGEKISRSSPDDQPSSAR